MKEIHTQPAVVCLVYREGLGPVFVPQSATVAGFLAAAGRNTHLAVFTPLGEFIRPRLAQRWREVRRAVRQVFPGPLTRLPSPPSRFPNAWNEPRLLSAWLRLRRATSPAPILHCRNAVTTNLALLATSSSPIIYDCRGLEDAEFLYQQGYRSAQEAPPEIQSRATGLTALQRNAALKSNAILCVSEAMRQYLRAAFSVPDTKMTVVPCCVDWTRYRDLERERDAMRGKLNLSDRFVVVFSGSSQRWQLPQESLAVFKIIKNLQPDAHCLVLANEPQRMTRFVREAGLGENDATVLRVEASDMPRHLAAGDVALLLREECAVNQVASPVKFAEYLASGLPVILTRGIGDYSALVEREGVGLIVPQHDPAVQKQSLDAFLTRYRADRTGLRRRCRAFAETHLSWQTNVRAITNLCERLTA